jgi:exopolysaccharide biosynthesis polyprenyl glycosylphosphotransferase
MISTDPVRGNGDVSVMQVVGNGRLRQRRAVMKASTIAADGLAIVVAVVLARQLASLARGWAIDPGGLNLQLGVLSVPLWILVFLRYGLYSTRHIANRVEEFRRLVHGVVASVLILAAVSFLLKLWVARSWLLLLSVTAVVTLTVERQLVRAAFGVLRRRGRLLRQAVIIGGNAEGVALGTLLESKPALGYRVLGFIDDTAPMGSYLLDGKPVLGPIDHAVDVARGVGADSAIVATSAVDLDTANRIARRLNNAGFYVDLSLSLQDIAMERLSMRAMDRFRLASIGPVHRDGWRGTAKRALDLAGAAAGLVLAAPLMLLIALAIKLDSRGPVLFRQERIGLGGKTFPMLKFRTMVPNAEQLASELWARNDLDGPLFKMRHDPRITRVGRVLRRFSLDEIPQLWNVLRGEMSLVGPRPALPSEVTSWSPKLHQRLMVKPGITGMWQVNGRSESSFEDYTRLDLYYVDNWSLLTDIAILAKTVPVVMTSRGAS